MHRPHFPPSLALCLFWGQVLGFLRPHLVSGTVIWFDDYLMTEGWQLNENKAWRELVEEHDIQFEWVAFGYMAVVVRIL
eukprot:COSAG06_NODE_31_length_31488_cov_60.882793_19_plen_79_part_00